MKLEVSQLNLGCQQNTYFDIMWSSAIKRVVPNDSHSDLHLLFVN